MSTGSTPKSKIEVNDNDKVSIYLELADAYRMATQEADAKQIMEEASLMFRVSARFRLTYSQCYFWLALLVERWINFS